MEFTYTLSAHDKAVDAVFGKEATLEAPEALLNCTIMAFVNRSGSNYVADALRTTGRFVGFDEILNDFAVKRLSEKYKVRSLADYVKRIYAEQVTSPSQIWGLKSGWMQLAMLLRTRIIPNLIKPNIILVRRKDVVGQAISFLIAEQTQRWSAVEKNNTTTGNDSVANVNYNGARILMHLRSIYNSYAMLDQIITLAGLPTFTVVYEEFLDRPNDIVSQIGAIIGGRALLPRLEQLRHSQQRNELNHEFRLRFMAEAAAMRWTGQ